MKDFTFIAWCSYGTEETEVEVSLSDKDARKLERYGRQPEIYADGFANCEDLEDIYNKVYAIAVEQMTEEIREYGDEDHGDDPDWQVDNTYECGVEFPLEFEASLSDD